MMKVIGVSFFENFNTLLKKMACNHFPPRRQWMNDSVMFDNSSTASGSWCPEVLKVKSSMVRSSIENNLTQQFVE